MAFQKYLKGLAAALVLGMALGVAPATAAEMDYAIVGPRFADDYHGYHLRGPYYLRDGWRYAPTHSRPHPSLLGYHDPYAPAHRHYRHREQRRVVVVVPSNGHRVANWAHVEWCLARYRTYRVRDNTFQSNHGRRAQCWSPYG